MKIGILHIIEQKFYWPSLYWNYIIRHFVIFVIQKICKGNRRYTCRPRIWDHTRDPSGYLLAIPILWRRRRYVFFSIYTSLVGPLVKIFIAAMIDEARVRALYILSIFTY